VYEAVWIAEVCVFFLNQHVEERAENVSDGDGNETQNSGTHIRYDASGCVGVGDILEEEVTRRR
jgi:hypothetical protein